jgi:hypothetical protein
MARTDTTHMIPLAQATLAARESREVVLRRAIAEGRAELRGARWFVAVPHAHNAENAA